MSAAEAIRAFVRAGGQARQGKGSHVNIKMRNGILLTLSGTREPVKIGILRAMLRKSEITEEQFLRYLGRNR